MYKNGVKFSRYTWKFYAILRFRPLELRLLIEHPVHRFLRTGQSRITRSHLRVCKSQHHRISFRQQQGMLSGLKMISVYIRQRHTRYAYGIGQFRFRLTVIIGRSVRFQFRGFRILLLVITEITYQQINSPEQPLQTLLSYLPCAAHPRSFYKQSALPARRPVHPPCPVHWRTGLPPSPVSPEPVRSGSIRKRNC